MTVQVGTAVGKAGEVIRGELRVGSLADGSPIRMPVFIATGKKPGPRVWIEGCIHGEEYGGAAAIIKYIGGIDLNALQGTVIAVPVANPASFNFRSRVSSIDGQNLNRIFPGNMGGSHSFQLASVLSEQLEKNADFLLDLHSGGIGAEVPFYVIYKDDGTEVCARSKELAKRVGCDTIWRSKETQGLGGTVTSEAGRRNIPSLTLECGGGSFLPVHMKGYLTAIDGFLRATKALPGDPPLQERYTIISDGAFIHNREGGLFLQDCKVGDIIQKDALIGRMMNLHGDIVEEIRCPYDNSYIAALRCQYYPTHAGEIAAEAIPVESYETV